MKKKNWGIWAIFGFVFTLSLLIAHDVNAKVVFLLLECLCYGVGLYKAYRGK